MSTRTDRLRALALAGATSGERMAAGVALCKHDPEFAVRMGLHVVGAGPSDARPWVSVEPTPLGQVKP